MEQEMIELSVCYVCEAAPVNFNFAWVDTEPHMKSF